MIGTPSRINATHSKLSRSTSKAARLRAVLLEDRKVVRKILKNTQGRNKRKKLTENLLPENRYDRKVNKI
jgi:hypothetical protein